MNWSHSKQRDLQKKLNPLLVSTLSLNIFQDAKMTTYYETVYQLLKINSIIMKSSKIISLVWQNGTCYESI